MPQSATNAHVRKVDVGSEIVISNEFDKKYFSLGDDNILKGYEHFPTDSFDKIDWKKPAIKPNFEKPDSHSI